MRPAISLVILDMAGTTIGDDGIVMEAFHAALADYGTTEASPAFAAAERIVRDTMGQSKIDVFRRVMGDERSAHRALEVFEQAYDAAVLAGRVAPIPGAESVLTQLRGRGIKTCLTTGFSVATRETLLTELGWAGAVDLVLSPSDAGRGRPHPDLLWTAMLRLRAGSVDEVAVVGDTASDMQAARHAGISLRCGVLTGADGDTRLREGGATRVLPSVVEVLGLL
jgi:phosphoglycolate phosphatase